MKQALEAAPASAEQAHSDTNSVLVNFDLLPPLLGPKEMAAIFRISVSRFYQLREEGQWDVFKVTPTLGPKCYSRDLLKRYVAGEPVFERRRRG